MDSAETPKGTAIEQFEQFGLSAYAARTYVALIGLGSGTAADVSDVSEVPRTRVYDAVEELHERGLVDIQHSNPKQFWPVSSETTSRKFEREFEYRAELLTKSLDELEPLDRRSEQRGVWTVTGHRAVTERVLDFFEDAEDEIVYMTVEDLLTDELVDGLHQAAKQGVTIKLAGLSQSVQTQISDQVPSAELFESLWVWSDTPTGRLMMIDGEKTLVSVRVNGATSPDDSITETAIWGAGETNSLVVVLRAIFTWRLDESEDERFE